MDQTPSTNTTPLPSMWNQNQQGIENIKKARATVGMKHGMFAAVPIICKGHGCPYFETCWIPEPDLQVGERCPIEIATILERFDKYCEQLRIDPDTEIVDAGLVKEVVDIEIMMVRADGLLAKDANLIEEVIAVVSNKGQDYYRPEIHLAVELKERLRKEKTRILNQLNATRKDRKEQDVLSDPSSVAASLIQRVQEMNRKGIILDAEKSESVEAEFTEEVNDDGRDQ